MSSCDQFNINMSQLLVDCHLNITRMLCQVEGALKQQQKKIKKSYNTVAKKLKLHSSPVINECERRDLEINLTVTHDNKGTLLVPKGLNRSFIEENNNKYIISPIPSPQRLKVTTKVQVKGFLVKTPVQKKRRKTIIPDVINTQLSTESCQVDKSKMDFGAAAEMAYLSMMETETARLDYKDISQTQSGLHLDPITCEIDIKKTPKKTYDNLSGCDSGYDNSDLDEIICHSPRSITSSTTDWSEGKCDKDSVSDLEENRCFSPKSILSEINDRLNEEVQLSTTITDGHATPNGRIHQNNESTPKSELGSISMSSSDNNEENGTFSKVHANNPCLPTPIQFKKSSDFAIQHTNVNEIYGNNTPVIQKLDYDMTGFSFSGSFNSECQDASVTFYTTTKDLTNGLNNTDLQSEITDALRQSLLDEEEAYDSDEENQAEISVLVPTSISISSEVLCEELQFCEQHILGQIDTRRDELHDMVDRWHQWIKQQIETAYQKEEERIKSESQKTLPVPCVKSPTKTMCTFLNTKEKLNQDVFGTFNTNTVIVDSINETETPRNNFTMCDIKHVRTFESRDNDLSTDYMATGLSSDEDGTYTVTDLGADTCRIFTQDGRLIKDLDVSPLDEPTYALSVDNGHTILACKSGLKFYTPDSLFSRKLAPQDIKCPQCVAVDSTGNYIISDLHDCGSVIVTLEKQTLLPLRIFCGTQYDGYPQSFKSAWYIHVTKSGNIILSDRDDHMIKAYTPHGQFLWSAGGLGAQPGQFFTPAGITEDKLGNILVADCYNDRVQVFTSTGKWLGMVVSKDIDEDIKCPTDVTVDCNGNIAVLLASGTVCIFTYLKT